MAPISFPWRSATRRRRLLGGLLVFGFGCSSAPASQGVRSVQSDGVVGVYRLVAVGSRIPEYWSRQGGCDVPVSSFYTFDQGRWVILDTVRAVGGCQPVRPPFDSVVTRTDSGYYRIVGDTLNLYVRDTLIGLKGWIDRGFVRGDTLVFPAGEFDPGDYVYVRQRQQRVRPRGTLSEP